MSVFDGSTPNWKTLRPWAAIAISFQVELQKKKLVVDNSRTSALTKSFGSHTEKLPHHQMELKKQYQEQNNKSNIKK